VSNSNGGFLQHAQSTILHWWDIALCEDKGRNMQEMMRRVKELCDGNNVPYDETTTKHNYTKRLEEAGVVTWARPYGPMSLTEKGRQLAREAGRLPRITPPPLVREKPGMGTLGEMRGLVEQFRQIIVYGPPGTGKTREAKRVALALLSGETPDESATDDETEAKLKPYRDADRFALVVFHPAYEYEQFVGGIEPTITDKQLAFQVKMGTFLRLCLKAEQDRQPSVLIIDEINRGHLSKLLGELVYALEYRDHEVRLPFAYADAHRGVERNDLIVPKNLYVIATMNSSDRSIGHIDVAIRRRFGLYHLAPRPEVVKEEWRTIDESYGNQLARLLELLNRALNSDDVPSAEAELGVGHSYFLPASGSPANAAKEQVAKK